MKCIRSDTSLSEAYLHCSNVVSIYVTLNAGKESRDSALFIRPSGQTKTSNTSFFSNFLAATLALML